MAGDAGAFARPHSAAGALKGMNDAIALGEALKTHKSLEEALTHYYNAIRGQIRIDHDEIINPKGLSINKSINCDSSLARSWGSNAGKN